MSNGERSAADSRYNRSKKGRARYARHREKTREQRRAYDRARMARLRQDPDFRAMEEEYYRGPGYVARRRRELGRQRESILDQLEDLGRMREQLFRELGLPSDLFSEGAS